MWIMLIEKLPTDPSPPKLSIHWAEPWPLREPNQTLYDEDFFGHETNNAGAMGFIYKGERIRVFPHEFKPLDAERMRLYAYGDPLVDNSQSHELVPGDESQQMIQTLVMDTDLRAVYEAALLDGATEPQAWDVVKGIPIDDLAIEFPPHGWYRCRLEYATQFCTESELRE